MPKIETYNYFICPECDNDAELSPKEFQKHIDEVHGIKSATGKRSMLRHLDAADWFAWDYEWTIEGKKFTQHIKQARKHRLFD